MKKIKNITFCFIAFSLGFVMFFGSYKIYAEDTTPVKTFDSGMWFPLLKSNYHFVMNDFFNQKLYKLSLVLEQENFLKDKNFNPPEDGICTDENVSSYCVATQSLDIYVSYMKALEERKDKLETSDIEIPLVDMLANNAQKNVEIDYEVDVARQVMEATVSAYDEYRLAYPMHVKYRKIIDDLIRYKVGLKVIRSKIINFPAKFIDATSVSCQ